MLSLEELINRWGLSINFISLICIPVAIRSSRTEAAESSGYFRTFAIVEHANENIFEPPSMCSEYFFKRLTLGVASHRMFAVKRVRFQRNM